MQSISNAVKLVERCREAGKPGHVIYISDFDPAGDNMPRSVARQLEFHFRARRDDFDVEITLEPLALTHQQVVDLGLPRKPGAKATRDRRSSRNLRREGEVELDALEALHPGRLEQVVREAVEPYQDQDLDSDSSTSIAARQDERNSGRRRPLTCALSWTNWPSAPGRSPSHSAPPDRASPEFERAIAPIRERAGPA